MKILLLVTFLFTGIQYSTAQDAAEILENEIFDKSYDLLVEKFRNY